MMRVPEKMAGLSLPEYRRQMGYTPGAGRSSRADDAFARFAAAGDEAERRAAGNFAATVGDAAAAGLKAYEDYQSAKATEAYNAFQRLMDEKMYGERGILTRQGEAAFSSAEDLENAMRESVERVSEESGLSADARLKLARSVFAYGSQALPKARKHAFEQRRTWQDGQNQAGLELAREGFLNSPDDTQARMMHLSSMRENYEHLASRNGWSAERKDLGWRKIQSGAYAGLVDRHLAAGNLDAARKLAGEDALWMEEERSQVQTRIQVRAEALAARAEAKRRKAEAEAEEARVESGYKDVMSDLEALPSSLTAEERKAKLIQFTAGMDDPKLRAAVRRRAEADIDKRELVRKAGVVEELGLVDRIRQANPRATSNEMIGLVRGSGLSDEAKAVAVKELEAEREGAGNEEASAAGLREARALYDASDGRMDDTTYKALLADLNLNARDRKAALEYPGLSVLYSQQRVDALISTTLGKETSGADRGRMYDALLRRIPPGEDWDDKRIKTEIYRLSRQGWAAGEKGWLGTGKISLADAILKDGEGRFRPLVPEASVSGLNLELEREYPYFPMLPEEGRELMRQAVWLRRQYGVPVEFTPDEAAMIRAAEQGYKAKAGAE